MGNRRAAASAWWQLPSQACVGLWSLAMYWQTSWYGVAPKSRWPTKSRCRSETTSFPARNGIVMPSAVASLPALLVTVPLT